MPSRYAAAHIDPQGPGDARPTALQVLKDEGKEGQLKAKVIVITGTSSGIGIETARALSLTGARLFLTARNLTKGREALADILEPGRVELIEMDHDSLASVRTAAKQILEKSGDQVNILIGNAGIMAIPTLQFTKDGFELQFGTNHLAHFLFFQLLKPALLASATPEFQSRVVSLASTAHRMNSINEPGNYNFEKGGYTPWGAYAQSKTGNVYMANEIERRYGAKGLHATSLHPGGIQTPLAKHIDAAEFGRIMEENKDIARHIKDPAQGAATTVWAAIGAQWEKNGGKYLEDVAEAERGADDGSPFNSGFVSHTYDPEREARLWRDSLAMVGLSDDL
ncbi:WW domain-containing oxidoreductase [Phlyctema vagabunda]|uniref:WW domain-containing oxidoreductase n=1 Tax=Phlyctema vagabunda TaxID=108571 RepID=A0ABR4P316_9HELO